MPSLDFLDFEKSAKVGDLGELIKLFRGAKIAKLKIITFRGNFQMFEQNQILRLFFIFSNSISLFILFISSKTKLSISV